MSKNNTDTVSIRPINSTDASALLKLVKVLITESDTFTLDTNLKYYSVEQQVIAINEIQATTTNVIFVAAYKDQLIGLATIQPTLHDNKQGEIGVAVLKAFQGNKLAQALIDESIYWAESYSTLNNLFLSVQVQNAPAIHIYQKFNFEVIPASTRTITLKNNKTVTTFDMQFDLTPLIG
ncbi:GNAT family N-acetyltransferase [Periweissella beninensis]|uniref:GNAT family N-acetyltransferase n=1 Tax=Periweissella beninensis TaxID=504936 RepID=A0ABT0VLM9_9LACO|nr:GNAT family N-acetyltransferase [Periweissella beninensis]MBM7544539.1 RimJ/RimL family protein N-acetyltransferase [Periweissella beninensis]MCM2438038.1 GNAT family N-acetyltransferase [Periweissella beninensis]MCT4395817.1 GNAT family N-acetyltransferase [Periweissella beninensis]